MGTRSLTHFKKAGKDSITLVTLYCQFDGYPSGVGEDIKRVLGERRLVNGYTDAKTQVNGMGCAAALFIAGVKKECGNWYIQQPDASDCGEEYVYTVYDGGGVLSMTCNDCRADLYDGPIAQFDAEVASAKEAVD